MNYVSTRNNKNELNFKDVFIKGLADDGGLFVPKNVKSLNSEDLDKLRNLSYNDLACEILNLFCSDFINKKDLKTIITKSYSTFREKEVVKISNLGSIKLLELYHGPTLAFKDIAMQFIGNLYDYYLSKNNDFLNVVVATSGDTGAAAIDAIKGKNNMNIFVLHPNNKISKVQRKLMTTGNEKNVFNIAIDGNFDDCQNLVKAMFADQNFSNEIKMSGVNSINWARIIAQCVYYFYSYYLIEDHTKPTNFSVPTGNFGDVYAGYLAKKMGLPINKLIVATNQNDILHRAISNGNYEAETVSETISPSMDIQIASNFERLIFDLNYNNSEQTSKDMMKIKEEGKYSIGKEKLNLINQDFLSVRMSETETLNVIRFVYKEFNVVLDPHTAIGYGAFDKHDLSGNNIVLATAHPCKFPDAIQSAINIKADLPNDLKFVLYEKENYDILENDFEKVKEHIKERSR